MPLVSVEPLRRLAIVLFGPCEVSVEGDEIHINPDDITNKPVTMSADLFLEQVADHYERDSGAKCPECGVVHDHLVGCEAEQFYAGSNPGTRT